MSKVFLLKESDQYKFGKLITEFEKTNDGILISGNFIKEKDFIRLNEKLDAKDERRIKDLIRQQLRAFLWNLYTKQSALLS